MAAEVRRRDPTDGMDYTLDELKSKWQATMSNCTDVQLQKYWLKECGSTCGHTPKKLLVIRHGQAQHNIKGALKVKRQKIYDTPLGPALTDEGKLQAGKAADEVASSLGQLGCSVEEALFITSNLLRAVETTCILAAGADVVVQPLLRERIAGKYDEPSDFADLQTWCRDHEVSVNLDAYEEAVMAAGDFPAYISSCWETDCVKKAVGWTDQENKPGLGARAAHVIAWLEEQSAPVVVLVGHSCFMPKITGDTSYMNNGELRIYDLNGGTCTRAALTPCVATKPNAVANFSISLSTKPNISTKAASTAAVRPASGWYKPVGAKSPSDAVAEIESSTLATHIRLSSHAAARDHSAYDSVSSWLTAEMPHGPPQWAQWNGKVPAFSQSGEAHGHGSDRPKPYVRLRTHGYGNGTLSARPRTCAQAVSG